MSYIDYPKYRYRRHWCTSLKCHSAVAFCLFHSSEEESVLQRVIVWRQNEEHNQSQILRRGVATWWFFLARLLDSMSTRATGDLSVCENYIFWERVTVEAPTIKLPNILVGICCIHSVPLWRMWTNIELVSWSFRAASPMTCNWPCTYHPSVSNEWCSPL